MGGGAGVSQASDGVGWCGGEGERLKGGEFLRECW